MLLMTDTEQYVKSRLFLYKFVMHEMREKNHKEHLKSYQTLDVFPPQSFK